MCHDDVPPHIRGALRELNENAGVMGGKIRDAGAAGRDGRCNVQVFKELQQSGKFSPPHKKIQAAQRHGAARDISKWGGMEKS